MKKTTQTFRQILTKVQDDNLQILMTKARTANRIAKSAVTVRTKRRAYQAKVNALSGLTRNFPHQVTIENDWKHGSGIVLVEVASKGFGLHAPAIALS
jgi:ribosomal protein S5